MPAEVTGVNLGGDYKQIRVDAVPYGIDFTPRLRISVSDTDCENSQTIELTQEQAKILVACIQAEVINVF